MRIRSADWHHDVTDGDVAPGIDPVADAVRLRNRRQVGCVE